MRRSVDLDPELEAELSDVVSLTKEKAAVVIRQALRAGLPAVANRFHSRLFRRRLRPGPRAGDARIGDEQDQAKA